jgi:hypothetical protein
LLFKVIHTAWTIVSKIRQQIIKTHSAELVTRVNKRVKNTALEFTVSACGADFRLMALQPGSAMWG